MLRGSSVRSVVLLTFISFGVAFAQQPAPKSTPPAAKNTESKSVSKIQAQRIELLQESYSAASALDVNARTLLLEKLCSTAEDLEDLEKSWCRELFQVARDQLSTGDLRAHMQTVAARSMSVHYPMTALAMLQEVDVTDAQSDERAAMARMVFEGVVHFKGLKAYPELMAAAARLGDTGAYPYLATATLLHGNKRPIDVQNPAHYSDAEVDSCNQVLQQGLTFFKRDTMNIRADFQFMALLRSAAFSGCPSGWMMHQAVTDLSTELVRVATAAINGDEKVKPHAAKMLYESGYHLLQEIDSVLAESIDKRVGGVRNVTDTASSSFGKVTPHQGWESDQTANALYRKIGDAEGVLNNAPDGTTPHDSEMESAIRDGFAAAQRLILKMDEVDPETAKVLRRGGGNMPSFLDAAFRIWPEAAIAQIRVVSDGEFKAHLLVTAANYLERNRERDIVQHRKPPQ